MKNLQPVEIFFKDSGIDKIVKFSTVLEPSEIWAKKLSYYIFKKSLFFETASQYSPSWPRTLHANQAGLYLMEICFSLPLGKGLKGYIPQDTILIKDSKVTKNSR